jgi:hypothetical protein
MGKIYNNLISTTAGFNYAAKQPLDDRAVVQSFADLAELVTSNLSYEGMMVYVVDDKKSYILTGDNWVSAATEKYVIDNVTKEQIGLGNVENKSSDAIRGELTSENVTAALGYTPLDAEDAYKLPSASENLGGVKTGGNVTISDGIITVDFDKVNDTTSYVKMTPAERTKLSNVENGANNYSLPTATVDDIGGIKVGSGLNINNGVLSVIVDSELDEDSVNPVQNKAVSVELGMLDARVGANEQNIACMIGDYSQGLKYTLVSDEYYSVAGIGTCTDTKIVIPPIYNGKPVRNIGANAFESCTSITSVTIPDSVTAIGQYAFSGCASITNIIMHDSVTTISNYAFQNCINLIGVIIGNGVKAIGRSSFIGCEKLVSVVLPNSVTTINHYAFQKCIALESIVIPDSVKNIGTSVFYNCPNLTIYCQIKEEDQPAGWMDSWNYGDIPVVWGVALDALDINARLSELGAIATADNAGLVKTGYVANNTKYPVELNDDGQMYVHVPVISSGDGSGITLDIATEESDGLMSAQDKTKLNYTNIAYGTCETAASTVEKEIVISGNVNWALDVGSIIIVKFTNTNTASSPTINVNSTGAKGVYYNGSQITTGNKTYAGYKNRYCSYVYDGVGFVFLGWTYDANTVHSNASLGNTYATCQSPKGTLSKVANSQIGYNNTIGGTVAVMFNYGVLANSTLSIDNFFSYPIYYHGNPIKDGVIFEGSTATFMFDGYAYNLISLI